MGLDLVFMPGAHNEARRDGEVRSGVSKSKKTLIFRTVA